MAVLELRQITKTYQTGAGQIPALRDVSLSVDEGALVAVMGPPGSGKSTLLAIAGALEEPTRGDVIIGGAEVSAMSPALRTRLRQRWIGYVFQDGDLLPGLTAAENVALPMELDGMSPRSARLAGLAVLEALGLARCAAQHPDELSAGERQRVGIARAIVREPRLLLADGPSGDVDEELGDAAMRMVRAACQMGVAAVVVTQDRRLAAMADRVIVLNAGTVDSGAGGTPSGTVQGHPRWCSTVGQVED